ncbi:MAG: galactokinase [Spirochaetaceae bacterium]|nr:MAG: galactokinase [Spirochaetaceae bacterium]
MSDVSTHHRAEFDSVPDIVVSAPGTVNLMGAHTEESEGMVLQVGLNRRMFVAVSCRKDQSLRFFAADPGERKRTTISGLRYKREDRWANLVKGVIAGLLERNVRVPGLNVTIRGDVPSGIGLASSAAITSATVSALDTCLELGLSARDRTAIAVGAERDFMGRTVGQSECITALYAVQDAALAIDTRAARYAPVGLELSGIKLLVTDSKVPISPARAEYEERLADCRTCVDVLQERRPGRALRDFTLDDLQSVLGRVPETARRRCLHVVHENQRVKNMVEALRRRDFHAAGRLLSRSHASLRDLYEVSCPEIDWLVKRSLETSGVLGIRITGNGFGGCAIALVEDGAIDAYYARLDEYERIFGFRPEAFVCRASAGARIEDN